MEGHMDKGKTINPSQLCGGGIKALGLKVSMYGSYLFRKNYFVISLVLPLQRQL